MKLKLFQKEKKKELRKNAIKKFKKLANTVKIANYFDKLDTDVDYDSKTLAYINRVQKN